VADGHTSGTRVRWEDVLVAADATYTPPDPGHHRTFNLPVRVGNHAAAAALQRLLDRGYKIEAPNA
jgi:hypothetical protein